MCPQSSGRGLPGRESPGQTGTVWVVAEVKAVGGVGVRAEGRWGGGAGAGAGALGAAGESFAGG